MACQHPWWHGVCASASDGARQASSEASAAPQGTSGRGRVMTHDACGRGKAGRASMLRLEGTGADVGFLGWLGCLVFGRGGAYMA